MRTIEIRRHSFTKKGESRGKGSHLSQAGIDLARTIGEGLGPYDLVVTSPSPRAVETALAMGFAVDETLGVLGDIPPEVIDEIGHHDRWSWDQPFMRFAELNERGGPTARMGEAQVRAWIASLESVPAGGAVLVISHGRVIEAGLVAAVPQASFASWEIPFRHCEGVRLSYSDGRFFDARIMRTDAPMV